MTRAKKTTKKAAEADQWDILVDLIAKYADTCIGESWKGGGDPADFDVWDARLALARSELNAHIERMKREPE